MDLKDKKLLVLGGASYMPDIRKYADKEGFMVYCAGGTHNKMMERYADKFFLVEATDTVAMVELVKTERIDGILSLGNESLINSSIDIAAETGIRFFINRENWNNLQNKEVFKSHCREFGISVVDEYNISDSSELYKTEIQYPIVIKPADGSGSQGVSVCRNETEATKAIEKAKSISRTQSILTERFILAPEFICTYIIHDGEPIIWMLGDRYMNRSQDGFGGISNCSMFPSRHADLFINNIHPKMSNLLKKYGPRDGTFFAQGFAVDGDILFFDPALRFCGTLDTIPYNYLLQINPLNWMINHTLVGIMDDRNEINRMDWKLAGNHVVQLSLHVNVGKIKQITGVDKIQNVKGVIDTVQLLFEGDIVNKPGTLQQVVARAFIVAKSFDEAIERINEIYRLVKITDEDGKDMLMPFSPYGLNTTNKH